MNEERKHRAAPRDGHGANSFGMGAGGQRGRVLSEGTGRCIGGFLPGLPPRARSSPSPSRVIGDPAPCCRRHRGAIASCTLPPRSPPCCISLPLGPETAPGGKAKLHAERVRPVPSGCGAKSRRKRRDEPGLPAPGARWPRFGCSVSDFICFALRRASEPQGAT